MLNLIFSLSVLLLTILPMQIPLTEGNPDTLTVPYPYPTIQAAVNAANPYDTIEVAAGIYIENVIANKSVTLRGEDSATTIIDANQTGHGVKINASNVQVHRFTIRNGGNQYAALYVDSMGGHVVADNVLVGSYSGIDMCESDGCTIIGNTLYNNGMTGIGLSYSDNNDIIGNNISESAYGIKAQASNDNFIINNTLYENSYSIYLAQSIRNDIINNTVSATTSCIYLLSSDDNDIEDNTVTDSSIGIYIYSSSGNSIFHNTMTDNSYGLQLAYSTGNPVDLNTASENDWGIRLYDADSNLFTRNTMRENTWGVYFEAGATANTLYHNNLIDNVKQVSQGLGNSWDSGGEGNYWSNYHGLDDGSDGRVAGDGIGDTDLPHAGLESYPLMAVWSEHELSITNVTSSDTWAYTGCIVHVNVTVENIGRAGTTETFNVTAEYDGNMIETKTVTDLANGASETITFSWDTTDAPPGNNYTLGAVATILLYEVNTADNSFIDGEVYVKLLGDVNDDGVVDVHDLLDLSKAYGSKSGDVDWNQNFDLNRDGKVDAADLLELTETYGRTI